jgi:hypothetical protein
MKKYDDAYDANLDKSVRIIKEYDLMELSLVDSPANQFANVLSIQKVDGVDTVQGDIADTEIENVFWDSESGIVMLSDQESVLSPTSGTQMQNIGFVEKNDNEKTDMIKFLVDSAKGINTIEINKEVSPMTDTTNEAVEVTTEEVATEVAVEETQVAPEADVVVESATEDTDVEKAVMPGTASAPSEEDEEEDATEEVEDEMKTTSKSDDVNEIDAIAEVKDVVTKAFSDLTAVVQAQAEIIAELSKSIDAVKNEVTANKDVFNEFGKKVDAVVADTAFRKSGDLGEIVQETQPEQVEKSLWGGRFLKTADLFK